MLSSLHPNRTSTIPADVCIMPTRMSPESPMETVRSDSSPVPLTIPNNLPWVTEREVEAVTRALREGRLASNAENLGPAKRALQQFTHGYDVLLTPSCTLALELALRCLGIGPGDEVMLPTFTFVSTANAVLQCGAKPVFVDIDDTTLTIDIDCLKAAITSRTRAIMPVHYAGISCDMDCLLDTAHARGIHVVEDAAHALGARYKGRFLGTLGDFGCFSFHDTKNHICGEGGALVLPREEYRERAECIYEKGTNRSAFLRGEIDKYTWVCQGSSYVMSSLLAVLLAAQLDRFEEILAGRKAISSRYREGLAALAAEGHIRFGDIPPYAVTNEHIMFFLVQEISCRDALLSHLQERGIGATFHYLPLHLSPFWRQQFGTVGGEFPVAERVADSIVRLPLFPHMTPGQCDRVIDEVIAFFHPNAATPRIPAIPRAAAAEEFLDFTLIVPCYNEAEHLHRHLDEIIAILDQTPMRYEIILIEDRSTDDTASLIRQYIALHPSRNMRALFHTTNMGRGAAVAEGLRAGRGRFAGFIDIDLEISAGYIPTALLHLRSGRADMVLGERVYKFRLQHIHRYLASCAYKSFTRLLLRTPPLDTETGFKFFRMDAIRPVLERTRDPHWFWDTEITVCAFDAGLRIRSEPVLFQKNGEKKSTVRLWHDGLRSLKSLLRFRRNRRSC